MHGCLSMNTDQEQIIQALKAVKNNERFISSEIANFLPTSIIMNTTHKAVLPFLKKIIQPQNNTMPSVAPYPD